jgi:predicted Na+-dependent transporter
LAGFALWVAWCFFGLVIYYCFAADAPDIQPSDFSLRDAVFVALLSAPIAVMTYGYWLQRGE